MLRSMADPFELNAAFLCVPTREKAKEQSPPALLFCIRINHFPLLCPEHSGGHFKSFCLPEKAVLPRNSRRPFPLLHPAICAIVTTFREKVSPSRWRNAKGGQDGKELLYRIIFYRKYGKNLLQIDNKRCIIYKWLWKPDTSSTDRLSLPVLRILCRRR